jgi:hypothetical protein
MRSAFRSYYWNRCATNQPNPQSNGGSLHNRKQIYPFMFY